MATETASGLLQAGWKYAPPPSRPAFASSTRRPAASPCPGRGHLPLRVFPFSTKSRSWASVIRLPATSNQITNEQSSRQREQPQPRLPAISLPWRQRGQVSDGAGDDADGGGTGGVARRAAGVAAAVRSWMAGPAGRPPARIAGVT